MPPSNNSARLFFALWPDDKTRHQLAEVALRLQSEQGKWVEPEKLHITLAFLGSVEAKDLSKLYGAVERVGGEPFELVLDRVQHWMGRGIVCLTAEQAPEALLNLVKALTKSLFKSGIPMDIKPFRPHVTLARKVKKRIPVGPVSPLCWPVRSFALVESQLSPEGSRYRVRECWNLAPYS